MPAGFEKCVREKGKVVTKTLAGGKYVHLCKNKQGKWFKGYVKTKQKGE